MSDTPRTDENEFDWVTASFARKLERELNAANEMLRKLNIHALNLTDRIRRLEEAGDAMEKYCSDYYSCNKWYKAKEAKP
jgi:hypothetical protein